jgi:hypothetical protein
VKRLGGTFCGALYSSEIPAVKQLDTLLMRSSIFVKTQTIELNRERKEKRLGGTFCGALYSSEIPAVKQLDTQFMRSNIFVRPNNRS